MLNIHSLFIQSKLNKIVLDIQILQAFKIEQT